MQTTPARAHSLAENLRSVAARISAVASSDRSVRLVAVSKLKPASDILALYKNTSHRHFGENYVQELLDKAQALPRDIKWHFIGALQTNKCKRLAEELPNLWAVESVDTIKKADALEKGRAALISASPDTVKLNIYIQVNTSGEESKSGCPPCEAVNLCRHIMCSCPHLELQGLMTIGCIARSKAVGKGQENDDFVLLRETADTVSAELKTSLELSMGMSSDFEQAILLGASNVRVGTTIFGERPPKWAVKST